MTRTTDTKLLISVSVISGGTLMSLLVVLFYACVKHRRRRHPSNLVLFHFISVCLAGASWLLAAVYGFALSVPQSFCFTQTLLVNYSVLSGAFWTAVHSFNLHAMVVRSRTATETRRWVPYYHLAGWLLPAIFTALIPVLDVSYDMQSLWCWLEHPRYHRVTLLYGPGIIACMLSCGWSGRVAWKLYQTRAGLDRRASFPPPGVRSAVSRASVARAAAMCVTYATIFGIAFISRVRSVLENHATSHEPGLTEMSVGLFPITFALVYLTTAEARTFYAELFCHCKLYNPAQRRKERQQSRYKEERKARRVSRRPKSSTQMSSSSDTLSVDALVHSHQRSPSPSHTFTQDRIDEDEPTSTHDISLTPQY